MFEKNWKALIRPKRLECEEESLTPYYGRFFAEPFERGFGITLGNSIRRVLLSSLQGAAIVAVKIDGVLHEFSRIDGVTEDVTDIILNLKQMRFKLNSDEPKELHAKIQGEGELRGRDFVGDGSVEVLTPDLCIATLGKSATLNMNIIVKSGKGFVPAERNKDDKLPLGYIPVDAIFTPVTRVNYIVKNARVGQVTDYDRVELEVWTDGSIRPEDAIAYAAKIMKDQLTIFINFQEAEEEVPEPPTDESIDENLKKSVTEMDLSVRAARYLKNAEVKTIGELIQMTEEEMNKSKNFGKKSLNEIKEALAEMGLHLGMKVKGGLKSEA